MLEILAVFFAAALFLVFAGQWLKGQVVRQAEGRSGVRKRAVALLALLLAAASLWLMAVWFEQPSPLTDLPPDELRASFALDTRQYRPSASSTESAMAANRCRSTWWSPSANL